MITKKITISNNDKLSLVSNLSTMLSAGIPILETVDSLQEDAKGNVKKILDELSEDLIQGRHMYSTFEKFPYVFDKVTVNIVKASEEAGTLETTLKDMKDQIKKGMEFNDKIKSALTYPIFIGFVFIAVMLLILVVVVPKISTVFSRLTVTLPLPTKILIFASDLVVKQPLPTFSGIAIVVGGIVLLYRSQKRLFLRFIFLLPLVTKLVQQIDLTRFSRSMYLLLSSGITITSALELAQEVVVKPEIAAAISHSKEMILAGRNLSEGFKDRKNVFPGVIIKIIEAGERTGTLDKSMQDISEHLDYEVNNTLKTLTTVLEPLMLVVVGVMVGGMMLAIIAPIYSLIGSVGNR